MASEGDVLVRSLRLIHTEVTKHMKKNSPASGTIHVNADCILSVVSDIVFGTVSWYISRMTKLFNENIGLKILKVSKVKKRKVFQFQVNWK